jgi:TolB-like protein
MIVMSYCDEVVIITHNSTIYLTHPSFVIKHASLSSVVTYGVEGTVGKAIIIVNQRLLIIEKW